MEKRALLAAGLSLLVLIVWYQLFPPQVPEPTAADPQEISAPIEAAPTAPVERETFDPGEPAAAGPERVEAASAQTFTVETAVHRVELTNVGARLVSWKLLGYEDGTGQPLELFPAFVDNETSTLAFAVDDESLTQMLRDARFAVERDSLGGGEVVTFRFADGSGVEAMRRLTFRPDDYLVDIEQSVAIAGRVQPSRVVLGPGFAAQDTRKGRSQYYYDGRILWENGEDVERLKRKAVDEPGAAAGTLRWAGLEDQFFTALVLPLTERGEVRWSARELTEVATLPPDGSAAEPVEAAREPRVAVSVPAEGAQLYIGPKKYDQLQELGHGLERAVNWYDWLAGIPRFIHRGLIWIHDNVVANWGWAIILATVVLRTLLFPLNQFAMVRMKKTQLEMQRIQPKLSAIKNRFRKKKDAQSRQQMNTEMMELYRAEGINPAGGIAGCLPMLLQFPILIAFYNMLTVAVELRGAPFALWIQDLSVRDPYYITPILMGATMFLQQKLAMTKVKDPQQLQQQRIMMFMPFVFTWFCLRMPSGLVLYWFVNNVLGIGQQWLVNKQMARLEPPGPVDKSKKKKSKGSDDKPKGKPKARLERA